MSRWYLIFSLSPRFTGADDGPAKALELYPFCDSGTALHHQCIDCLYHLLGIVSFRRLRRSAHVTSRLGVHSHGGSRDGTGAPIIGQALTTPADTDSIVPPLPT